MADDRRQAGRTNRRSRLELLFLPMRRARRRRLRFPTRARLAGADAEKAAMVEQAKSRVAAVKESLGEKAAGQPRAPAPQLRALPKLPSRKRKKDQSRSMLPTTSWSRN